MTPEGMTLDALRTARNDTLQALVYVLERGDRLSQNGFSWMGSARSISAAQDLNERIRSLRRQLIERDLYEQMYGPLPFVVGDEGDVNERTEITLRRNALEAE